MKRSVALRSAALCGAICSMTWGCMVREPAPICPVPIQATSQVLPIGGYAGVDMLLVVDNSGSMSQEQQVLATGLFTLLNALIDPVDGPPPADDVRVAIVTSDLGTQFGRHPGPESAHATARGDDGAFRKYTAGTTVRIEGGAVACDDDASQCPGLDWTCANGFCEAPTGSDGTMSCPGLGKSYAELLPGQPSQGLPLQVACLANAGTGGCGYEQQLEASVLGLEKHLDFLRNKYLLAVMVVSDEEDCSVADGGLWETKEFKGTLNNVACNYPASNEENFLYAPSRYKQELTRIKGDENAVVFAAIVGVPAGQSNGCEGSGDELGQCNDHPKMQLEVNPNCVDDDGSIYTHFSPACVRDDDPQQPGLETEARPGRRYVEVAQDFGPNGYVYSICNKSWAPAMEAFASLIEEKMDGSCYDTALTWNPETKVAQCDVVAQLPSGSTPEDCPAALKQAWLATSGGDEEAFRAAVLATTKDDGEGEPILGCPLPKIPMSIDCAAGMAELAAGPAGRLGWYYCENEEPDEDECRFKVELTAAAADAVRGKSVAIQCLQQFSFEDENCQEHTADACQNDRDDDGNGAFDCWDDFDGPSPHRADAHCCPLEVEETEAGAVCRVELAELEQVCGETTPTGAPLSAVAYPDACDFAAAAKGCVLELR